MSEDDPHTPNNTTQELIADLLARPDGLTELLQKEALRSKLKRARLSQAMEQQQAAEAAATPHQREQEGLAPVTNFYAKCPKPAWWPFEEWNASQMKRGRSVLETIWSALQELQRTSRFAR
ncbi:hypothetical protein WJX73_003792 [Symbiochloris irregularis]|uniref:Uncharacterized protein n=1 Tax=Symbiochloris irregularis TaxID=706552 RepID=A0AAW1PLT9_9CHLO